MKVVCVVATGRDDRLPWASLALNHDAMHELAPGQWSSRLKQVWRTIYGPSPYASPSSLPADLQTAAFSPATAADLLAAHDAPGGQEHPQLDVQQQVHREGVAQQQALISAEASTAAAKAGAASGSAYVERFHGFAQDGRLLISGMEYGPGDVLLAAKVSEWSQVSHERPLSQLVHWIRSPLRMPG